MHRFVHCLLRCNAHHRHRHCVARWLRKVQNHATLVCNKSIFIKCTVIIPHSLCRIRTWSDVLKCFSSFGEHSRKHKNCLSTTRQFSSKFFPAAGPLEEMMASLDAQNLPQDARIWVEEAKAHVSPPQLFGTTWNLMIKALRSEDLLSNYEMSMMTFGKGWHNIPQWPLWCVQGRAHTFLTYMVTRSVNSSYSISVSTLNR